MSDVEIGRSEIRQAKRRHNIPDAEKPDLRRSLYHDASSFFANPAVLDDVAEIEGRRRTTAEPHDVDDLIAVGPRQTELVIRFVQPYQFARPEHAADDPTDDPEPGADSSFVAVMSVTGVCVVSVEKASHVGIPVFAVIVLRLIPSTVKREQCHVPSAVEPG